MLAPGDDPGPPIQRELVRHMIDYVGAVILFLFMVTVLYVLWRREHPKQ